MFSLFCLIALFLGNTAALLQSPEGKFARQLRKIDLDQTPALFFQDSTVCDDFWLGWEFSSGDACSALNNCDSNNAIYLFSPDTELCTIVKGTDGSSVNFVYGDPIKFERLAFTVWESNLAAGQNCRIQFTKIDRGTAPAVCPANHQCVTCGDSSGINWVSVAVDSVWS